MFSDGYVYKGVLFYFPSFLAESWWSADTSLFFVNLLNEVDSLDDLLALLFALTFLPLLTPLNTAESCFYTMGFIKTGSTVYLVLLFCPIPLDYDKLFFLVSFVSVNLGYLVVIS